MIIQTGLLQTCPICNESLDNQMTVVDLKKNIDCKTCGSTLAIKIRNLRPGWGELYLEIA